MDHAWALIERVLVEPGSHAEFSQVIIKVKLNPSPHCVCTLISEAQRFATLTSALDLESFHHLCKTLYLNDAALDIISLHVKISDLVFYALSFLEEYECETVGK